MIDDWEPFQLKLREDPFWLLVACILANRTRWEPNARTVLGRIREAWPTAEDLSEADHDDVGAMVSGLGFWYRRSWGIIGLANAWMVLGPPDTAEDVAGLPGCGRYAADSWAIFVEGRRDRVPADKALVAYLERIR